MLSLCGCWWSISAIEYFECSLVLQPSNVAETFLLFSQLKALLIKAQQH
jgi:hypothetical protein